MKEKIEKTEKVKKDTTEDPIPDLSFDDAILFKKNLL